MSQTIPSSAPATPGATTLPSAGDVVEFGLRDHADIAVRRGQVVAVGREGWPTLQFYVVYGDTHPRPGVWIDAEAFFGTQHVIAARIV